MGFVTQLQRGGHRAAGQAAVLSGPWCRQMAGLGALMFPLASVPAVAASTEHPAVRPLPHLCSVPRGPLSLYKHLLVLSEVTQTLCFWLFSWGPVSRFFFGL